MVSAFRLTVGAALFIGAALAVPKLAARTADVPSVVATDTLLIHVSLLERPIGIERAIVAQDAAGIRLTSDDSLLDRGSLLRLRASLELSPALAPVRFTATGKSYRFVDVDADVAFTGETVAARDHGNKATVKRPRFVWPGRGWPPLSARALLVRYWERNGRPAAINVLPADSAQVARITFRGTDRVSLRNQTQLLKRYEIDGLVWGRETLWLDERDRFAAIVTRIHILPMEGIRDDLKDALPTLQQRSIADRVADLETMRQRLTPNAAGSFALRGATIIDGTDRPPIVNGTVVVLNNQIADVGPASRVRIPPELRIIDTRGATIIPGLWDMHAHAAQIEWFPAYLAAGVTTIRDMGGEEPFLLAMRRSLGSGQGLGPNFLLAGLVDGDASDAFGTTVAGTPDQGRDVVDHYRGAGFDQIKLYSVLAPDVVDAIIARAHGGSLTVTGHVPRALGTRRSIEAGMDQIAHLPVSGDTSTNEVRTLIQLLAQRQVVVDPTIPWNELLGRSRATAIRDFEPGIDHAPPALAGNYRNVINPTTPDSANDALQRQLAILRAMHNAGVPLVAGTDGAIPGFSLLRSIELFVRAGFTPRQAIQSATIVPARAMKRDEEIGTVERGKRADLVILDRNPLADITNIRSTRWVVANGRLYESAQLWRLAGFVP